MAESTFRTLLALAALGLAACQSSQPVASAGAPSSAHGTDPYPIPTSIAPQFPGSLDVTPMSALGVQFRVEDTPLDPPLPTMLATDLSYYAALVDWSGRVLTRLAAASPAPDATVDVTVDGGQPLVAKRSVYADHALILVATDAGFAQDKTIFAMNYDATRHGYLTYRPANSAQHTAMSSLFHLDRGTASVDVLTDLPLTGTTGATGRATIHEEFRELRENNGGVQFGLKDARTSAPTGGTIDRFSLAANFLDDPLSTRNDGAMAAIAGHKTPDSFSYDHGDGTPPNTNERESHGIYALVGKEPATGKPRLETVSGADVPVPLTQILPQDSSLPEFAPDPTATDAFADPVVTEAN